MLSPMNFSTSPPNSLVISGAATPQYTLRTAAASAGVERSEKVVNPTRSPNSTLIVLPALPGRRQVEVAEALVAPLAAGG